MGRETKLTEAKIAAMAVELARGQYSFAAACTLSGVSDRASAKDLQWYKGLLLKKPRELSSVQGDAGTQVPATGKPCRDPRRENAILTPPGNGAI